MQRFHAILFAVSLAMLSWLLMMAVHELGHIVGAWLTGGRVETVVLHPLSISRTDVAPNPHPAVVVWLGPLLGCLLPLAILLAIPKRLQTLRNSAKFFAGFCLIANGAYIAFGALEGIGDSGEMLRKGTPTWCLLAFGAVTIPLGLYQWHQLGSLVQLFQPTQISAFQAYLVIAALAILITLEFLLMN